LSSPFYAQESRLLFILILLIITIIFIIIIIVVFIVGLIRLGWCYILVYWLRVVVVSGVLDSRGCGGRGLLYHRDRDLLAQGTGGLTRLFEEGDSRERRCRATRERIISTAYDSWSDPS